MHHPVDSDTNSLLLHGAPQYMVLCPSSSFIYEYFIVFNVPLIITNLILTQDFTFSAEEECFFISGRY